MLVSEKNKETIKEMVTKVNGEKYLDYKQQFIIETCLPKLQKMELYSSGEVSFRSELYEYFGLVLAGRDSDIGETEKLYFAIMKILEL